MGHRIRGEGDGRIQKWRVMRMGEDTEGEVKYEQDIAVVSQKGLWKVEEKRQ